MFTTKNINFVFFLLLYNSIYPHGFGEKTLIQDAAGSYWHINGIVQYVADGQDLSVPSYDEYTNTFVTKKIKSVGLSETKYCCHLTFNHDPNPLTCTPLQLFYKPKDGVWIAAYKLKSGDQLLCGDYQTVVVDSVEVRHENLKIYTLEIKKTHTFLVGKQNIVAHNLLIPIGAVAGLTIPVDIGCGASFGSMFGPVGICAGVVVGGLVGCAVNACFKDKVAQYNFCFKPQEIMAFNNSENTIYELAKSVEDILQGAVPGRKTTGKIKQYVKPGNYEDALKDFNDLQPNDIRIIRNNEGKEGLLGTLSDGSKVNVRSWSDNGSPTIEIQIPNSNGKAIKIRYDNNNDNNNKV